MARRSHSGELREWLNAGAAVGMLLIGVATFWVTVQVSGLEDYFHSEVVRRNNELNEAAERSGVLERQATLIRADLDALTIRTIAEQNRYAYATNALRDVQFSALQAQTQLAASRGELESVSRERDLASKTIDLIYRRETFSLLAMTPTYEDNSLILFNDDISERPSKQENIGEAFRNFLVTAKPDGRLRTYYSIVETRLPGLCPNIFSRSFATEAIPAWPNSPSREPHTGENQVTYDRRMNAENEAFSAALKAQSDRFTRAIDIDLAHEAAFQDEVKTCVCQALSTDNIPASDICPAPPPAAARSDG